MSTSFPLQPFEALSPISEPAGDQDWDSFKAEFVAIGDTISEWHLALWNARKGMVIADATSFITTLPPV